MFPFGLAIFTGAFLLFLVQLVMARFILPWFGGGPAVWTTCMLFFQVLLLGGYAYADLSIRKLAPRVQVCLHLALLAGAMALLPITPGDRWKPLDGNSPAARILLLLTACLGLPFLVLSATGPLMQAWFNRAYPGVAPFRLYALSNIGSLLALVAYPILIEPNLARRAQAGWWSIGLGVFALFAAWCGGIVWRRAERSSNFGSSRREEAHSSSENVSEPPHGSTGSPSRAQTRDGGCYSSFWWFALPACASVLLLAVTNKICQDIAVIPFLWVLPLGLYLLSFIISFDNQRWYWRPLWLPALAIAIAAALWVMLGNSMTAPTQRWLHPLSWLLQRGEQVPRSGEIAIYLAGLFVCCLVCHGEVYRLRPRAEGLTGFYLLISAGGAFGGVFVAVVAPLIFKNYFELHAGLVAVAVLVAALLFVDSRGPLYHGKRRWAWALIIVVLAGTGWGFYKDARASVSNALEISRSFYGVLKVIDSGAGDSEYRHITLEHGDTTHGMQFVAPDKRHLATSYYTPNSGVGRALRFFPRATNRQVGIVGLGTGTLAVYGKAGDDFRIYEINPEVRRLAESRFSFLAHSAAKIEIVPGDARLSLEREPSRQFDILALDAFTSDAIPVHLLTCEAFQVYLRHLKPDGVIAVHISNRYLRLEPVVMRLADHLGLDAALIEDDGLEDSDIDAESGCVYESDWVLLSHNQDFLKLPEIASATKSRGKYSPKIGLWTDEESNLFRILSF
jgi:SAM-dependent methyltransferase